MSAVVGSIFPRFEFSHAAGDGSGRLALTCSIGRTPAPTPPAVSSSATLPSTPLSAAAASESSSRPLVLLEVTDRIAQVNDEPGTYLWPVGTRLSFQAPCSSSLIIISKRGAHVRLLAADVQGTAANSPATGPRIYYRYSVSSTTPTRNTVNTLVETVASLAALGCGSSIVAPLQALAGSGHSTPPPLPPPLPMIRLVFQVATQSAIACALQKRPNRLKILKLKGRSRFILPSEETGVILLHDVHLSLIHR